MKRSYIIAGVLALAAIGWMFSGWIGESDRPTTGRKPPADLSLAETVPTVRVRRPGGPMYPMKRVNIDDLCYYPGGVITCTS